MANRTVKDAHSVKGTNPQYLVEKIIRTRIYECRYWKEECFALTAELLVDKAMGLKFVGGVFGGNIKPTPFLCLLLKMLQIQPEKDIIVEFIRNEDFKYVRALGALYMRLTGTSTDCYKYLEPLYLDYRKLKRQKKDGEYEIVHMDEFIDELLRDERSCDIIMPRIQKRNVLEESNLLEARVSVLDEDLEKRNVLEESNLLEARVSALDEDLEDMESEEEEEEEEEDLMEMYKEAEKKKAQKEPEKPSSPPRAKRSPSPRHRDRDRNRKRSRSRERDRERKSDKRHKDDDRKHRSHKSKHDHKDKEERHKDRHRGDRHRGDHSGRGMSKEEIEIMEANKMRAELGLAPLRM